jgi:hypothetical protein
MWGFVYVFPFEFLTHYRDHRSTFFVVPDSFPIRDIVFVPNEVRCLYSLLISSCRIRAHYHIATSNYEDRRYLRRRMSTSTSTAERSSYESYDTNTDHWFAKTTQQRLEEEWSPTVYMSVITLLLIDRRERVCFPPQGRKKDQRYRVSSLFFWSIDRRKRNQWRRRYESCDSNWRLVRKDDTTTTRRRIWGRGRRITNGMSVNTTSTVGKGHWRRMYEL